MRREASWRPTSRPRCSPMAVSARPLPGSTTSRASSATRCLSITPRPASTQRSPGSGSSSSRTERPQQPVSGAFSSPARESRSAHGDCRTRCRSWRFPCARQCNTCRWPRRHQGHPVHSRAPRRRRWAACWKRAASPTSRWRRRRSGFEWESPEEFTTFIKEIAPPITSMIAPHPPDVQEEAWAAITDATREATGGAATVRLTNLVLLASGRA